MQAKIDRLRELAKTSAAGKREILVLVRHAINILERKAEADGLLNQAILGPGYRLNDNLFDA